MNINQSRNGKDDYILIYKSGKFRNFTAYNSKIFLGVLSKSVVFGVLVLAIFLGSGYLGYGSDWKFFHKNDNNDSAKRSAEIAVVAEEDNNKSGLEKESVKSNNFSDYEVVKGDTIWSIAEKYNIGISKILQANNLTVKSIIQPGQKIILPMDNKPGADISPKKINIQVRASRSINDYAESTNDSLQDDNPSERKPFDYEVESGDTVSRIAEKYNLKINTILWANNLTVKSIIQPGQKLVLLPVDGVLHEVKKGEIVGKIALMHKADPQKTIDYNEIVDPTKIYPGDMIIIPDGQPLPPPPKPSAPPINKEEKKDVNFPSLAKNLAPVAADNKLLWPTSAKKITQGYWAKHRGIDIANGGTPPIFASHDGVVEFAGRKGDWGNTILLRRSDGLTTRYSHASEIYVTVGQEVKAGDTIAKIGTTGRSTGNHLDFRVYINGVAANPLKLF